MVELTKSINGLGILLDHRNVVIGLKEGSEAKACGLIYPGDLVISLNGVQVSESKPVKSVAIDIDDGEKATFVLLRGAVPPTQPASDASPSATPLLPIPGAAAAPTTQSSFCYPHLPTETVHMPPVPPPSSGPPPAGEDEDDVLAKRLEMLRLPRN